MGKRLDLLSRQRYIGIKEIRKEERLRWTRLYSVLQIACLRYMWFAFTCKCINNFAAFIPQHSPSMYTAPIQSQGLY